MKRVHMTTRERRELGEAFSPAEIFAAGLQLDRTANDAGYSDAINGRAWDPDGRDLLSYASGFAAGEPLRKRRN